MIYFFNSTNKKDKLKSPITVLSNSSRKAFAMALINFKSHGYKGSPKEIKL